MRMDFHFHLVSKRNPWKAGRARLPKLFELYSRLKQGARYWLGSYECLVFCDATNGRIIDGQFFLKDFGYISKALQRQPLFISSDKGDGLVRFMPGTRSVSADPISILAYLMAFFIPRLSTHAKSEFREEMSRGFDVCRLYRRYLARRLVYKLLLVIYKPKVIFIHCCYSYLPLLEAAKATGVKSVEIQHGDIMTGHPGYILPFDYPSALVADEIWVYGESDKMKLMECGAYRESKIFPLGCFMASHYLTLASSDVDSFGSRKAAFFRNNGDISLGQPRVLVTGQNSLHEEMFDFAAQVALLNSQLSFYFLPRGSLSTDPNVDLPHNLKILHNEDFYEVINFFDIHCTTFSTTARESLWFGVPNIFFDIQGLSTEHMGTDFPKSSAINYISSPMKFNEALQSIRAPVAGSAHYFEPLYFTNFQVQIEALGLD